MTDPRLIIAPDACVLIEGIHLRGRTSPHRKRGPATYPSVRILRAAQLKWYRLYVVDRALSEARRALRAYGEEEELDAVLAACDLLNGCPETTAASVCLSPEGYQAELDRMTACLRDPDDAPIAVDLRFAAVKPHLFVSSNHTHWRQSVGDAIGGVRIVRSTELARRLHPDAAERFGY